MVSQPDHPFLEHVLQAGRNASSGINVVLQSSHTIWTDSTAKWMDASIVGREQERTWYRVTEAEYRRLVGKARRNEVTLLNQYGATNRAEFFAVATECFFERPHAMRRSTRNCTRVLRDFYRQDPAQWLPDAAVAIPDKAQRRRRRTNGPMPSRSNLKIPTSCSRSPWFA